MTTFGNKHGGSQICLLTDDENITEVTIHVHHKNTSIEYNGLIGIQFITNKKECPLFGSSSFDSVHASGHQLLVMEGRNGSVFIKKIELYFDYGCKYL